MEESYAVPPGFRFHPTEEELVGYYLERKVASQKMDLDVIKEVDLYRIEPWDLLENCKLGSEEQNEWYFFSHNDKKYPSGSRTNRATAAGFWKATGRDKAVLSKSNIIGMRKTLVFYKGRAPNGRKTDWIMHEYRLQSSEHGPPQEEGWVVCRAFRKPCPNQTQCFDTPSSNYRYEHQFRLQSLMDSSQLVNMEDSYTQLNFHEQQFAFRLELEPKNNKLLSHVLEIPQLQSPSLSTNLTSSDGFEPNVIIEKEDCCRERRHCMGQLVDWKSLDKLLSAQTSESSQVNSSTTLMIPIECEAETHSNDEHYLRLLQS